MMEREWQEVALNRLANGTRDTRLDFLREFLTTVNDQEFGAALNLVINAKKKFKRRALDDEGNNRFTIQNKKPRSIGGAQESLRPSDESGSKSAAPASAQAAPESAAPALRAWYYKYKKSEVVGIDVEKVTLHNARKDGKKILAGTVAIVDAKGTTLYKSKIYHAPGSFVVNYYTKKANGFQSNSLADGKKLEDVTKEIEKILTNKLIIVMDGVGDFLSLDLSISEYDVWDAANFFQNVTGENQYGEALLQPLSLRSLYLHYFNKDIQSGEHDAEVDARATVEIFVKYTQLYPEIQEKYLSYDFIQENDPFQNIKRVKKN